MVTVGSVEHTGAGAVVVVVDGELKKTTNYYVLFLDDSAILPTQSSKEPRINH